MSAVLDGLRTRFGSSLTVSLKSTGSFVYAPSPIVMTLRVKEKAGAERMEGKV